MRLIQGRADYGHMGRTQNGEIDVIITLSEHRRKYLCNVARDAKTHNNWPAWMISAIISLDDIADALLLYFAVDGVLLLVGI